MTETTPSLDFVLAAHYNEYGYDIGSALLEKEAEVVALEWAEIGRTEAEVAAAIPRVRERFKRITDPQSTPDVVQDSIARLGPLYGPMLTPLVGSSVEIDLIDIYKDPELGIAAGRFHLSEMDSRLTRVVASSGLSLSDRLEEIEAIAERSAFFISAREKVVKSQLETISKRAAKIAIYQGLAHQAVADEVEGVLGMTSKTFVPALRPWSQEAKVEELGYATSLDKLTRALEKGVVDEEHIVNFTERALLTEYLVAFILHNPLLVRDTDNMYGAMIAATRICESLEQDKVKEKLKAIVKGQGEGVPVRKYLKPILPRHSLTVLAR